MENEKFLKLAFVVIEDIGEAICQVEPSITWAPDWKSNIERDYLRWRDKAKSKLNIKAPTGGEKRVDRHKIGAALAIAILQNAPLTANASQSGKPIPVIGHFPNEFLAFKSAMQIVVEFAKGGSKDNPIRRAYLNKPFIYPEANDGKYCVHVYKALYHTKKDKTYDILLLANLLFTLESHNDQYQRMINNQN